MIYIHGGMVPFKYEADFEKALIKVLSDKGWEHQVLKYPTEQNLIHNWAKILFDNNRGIDRLNDHPLTDGEMQQIIEQINTLKTPLKLADIKSCNNWRFQQNQRC